MLANLCEHLEKTTPTTAHLRHTIQTSRQMFATTGSFVLQRMDEHVVFQCLGGFVVVFQRKNSRTFAPKRILQSWMFIPPPQKRLLEKLEVPGVQGVPQHKRNVSHPPQSARVTAGTVQNESRFFFPFLSSQRVTRAEVYGKLGKKSMSESSEALVV